MRLLTARACPFTENSCVGLPTHPTGARRWHSAETAPAPPVALFNAEVRWAVLDGLTETERAALLALGRHQCFARNDVVCHMGDPADSFHLVERGRLGVRVRLPSGEAALTSVLGPGAAFGEVALVRSDRRWTATVVALEAAGTLSVPRAEFRALRERRPELGDAVLVLMADRIDDLSRRLLDGMHMSFDRRLHACLLDLAIAYADGESGRVVVPLTQSQLAEMTGGTRPTVNVALQKLSDQGIVGIRRGRLEIRDVERLRRKVRR